MAAMAGENTPEQLSASPAFLDLLNLAALKAAQDSQTVAETMSNDPGLTNKIAFPIARAFEFLNKHEVLEHP